MPRQSGSRTRKVRARARQRDQSANAKCWICGQPIDYTLTEGRECWEPDHYWPVITHPHLQYDLANNRPSHRRCNRNRGDKAPEIVAEQSLGMQSRQW